MYKYNLTVYSRILELFSIYIHFFFFFRIFSWFSKAYPFLEFHKVSEDGQYQLVYRTEVVNWTNNPTWKPIILPVRSLCGTDFDRDIKIICYHYKPNGDHLLIGKYTIFKLL